MSKKYLLYIHNDKFQVEQNKSDLVNKLLAVHYEEEDTNIKVNKDNTISLKDSKKPFIIKTPKQVTEKLNALPTKPRTSYQCKEGHLSNEYGKCLQKGCKYAK